MKYLALFVLLGCAPLSTIGTYTRPPSICSHTNVHSYRIQMWLSDELGHQRWVGNADSSGHVCTEWDLPGDRGRWGWSARDGIVHWEPYFQAWALR